MDIYIARGQEQFGPYPLDQIQQLLDSGVLKPDDFAFHEGLDNWTPLPELIAAQASDLPTHPAMPAPADTEPASPAEPACETLPVDPAAQPAEATAPHKPKKGVPIWLRILAWILVLGLILAVTIGVSVWYWYKPDPLEDEPLPLMEEIDPGMPGMPPGPGPTSGNQNNNPSEETTNQPNESESENTAGADNLHAKINALLVKYEEMEAKDPDKAGAQAIMNSRALARENPNEERPWDLYLSAAKFAKDPEEKKAILEEVAAAKSPKLASLVSKAKAELNMLDALGKPVDIQFTATDGTKVDLTKMKGKVVLIDFWATWCGPCIREIPSIKKTYAKLSPKGFEIVGISLDSDKDKLLNFIKEKKMPWVQYFDGLGWNNKISTKHGIRSIPAMWLIDKNGNLVDKNARNGLEGKVEKLLAANAPTNNDNNNPSTNPVSENSDNDSLAELEQSAENGFTLAQTQLGLMHLTSQDPQIKNPALAIKWLERAAKQGHPAAQANAAQYYFSQNNPKRNLIKAAYWASLAARANGRQQTQYKELLAKILGAATPDQVKKSRALASNFTPIRELTNAKLKNLANQGNPRAQQTLGYLYVGGRDGINKDTNEAVRWWTRAARQGWPISQNNLGNVFSRGKIRPKDLVQAYMWASLADQNGMPTARQTLNQIQREITPDQIKEATLLVENFKPLAEKSLIGDPGKLTPAQVENILAQEIGSWKVKGTTVTFDPNTGIGEAKEFEDQMETRWKEKGKSTISNFGSGMGQNLTGTTVYDSEMEWFIWRVQGEGRPETVSKNIYDPATKTYHQLLMLPNDHVERGTFKRINKDEAILKSEIFNADNVVVATHEINFTRIYSDVTEPNEPEPNTPANKPGTVLWEFETGNGVDSSPAIGPDGTVYVGSQDTKLYALSGKTGAKLWEFKTGADVDSSPAIGPDGTVYVGSWNKKLYALSGKTGDKLWEFETGDGVESSPAIGPDGTVYVGSYDGKLYALSGKTGVKLWEFQTGGTVSSSPAIGTGGTLYVGSGDHKLYAKLYALSGKTGAKLWEFKTGRTVYSSPAIGTDGTLYVGSGDRKLYAINGKTGVKLWEFKTGGEVWSSPAIGTDGTVYVGSADNKLYALSGKTGDKLWEFETGDGVESSPAIGSDGTVYVGSDDGKLYALSGKTGVKLWEFQTGGVVVRSSPAIGTGGTLYVGSGDHKLYAIKTNSKDLAKSPWPMRGQNAQRTGRTVNTATEPTEPTKKLTANQASEVMAWEIGSWEAKGQGQPAGGQPNPIAITREVRWKEEGKSLKYKFSLVENGKPVTYFGHQEYDAAMGVFVYRSKWGNNPETTSHEVYDVTTRTTQGRSMPAPSEGEPSTTTITKRVGDDRSEQTLEITQNGQVIYSHKIVSTRIKTAPIEKKLSSAEVDKILAAQIGQWQVKGQLKPANEEPIDYEFTLNVQWQEKGKSISSTGTLEKAGEKISLFSSKEYDPSKGVFAFRFRQGLRPEVLSHEQYDPATQTFQGRQISPEEPEVTYTFQADGPDKFIFKSKTTRNGQLISTDESIQIRAPKPEK